LKKKELAIVFGDNLLECKSQVKNLVSFYSTLSFEFQVVLFVSDIIIFEMLGIFETTLIQKPVK